MPSSYSTNLKIELQATGENSGTWGTITNTNLGTALEQAIVGYGNPSYASDANLTLTYTDTNAAQAARALVLNVTSAVSLTNTRELVVPTIQKQYIVQNNTTGSQSITVKTSGGTGITVPNGRKAHLYVNGTDVIYMDDYVDINGGAIDGTPIGANSASTGAFTTLSASGNITVSGGTANGVLYLNGSKVATSGSALVFDGTNLGIGVTPSAADSTLKYLTVGNAGNSFAGFNGGLTSYVLAGAVFNSGWKYAVSGSAVARYDVGAGTHTWFTAASGTAGNAITFTQAMTLDSSGNLGIGTSSPGTKLHIKDSTGTAVNLLRLETPYSNPSGNKSIIWTDTTDALGRISISYTAAGGSQMSFGSLYNGGYQTSDLMVLNSSGNLGLGVTPSAWGSPFKAFEGGDSDNQEYIAFQTNANAMKIGTNHFYNGSNYVYKFTGAASRYDINSDSFIWNLAASGTAGNAITFTQAMTLDCGASVDRTNLIIGATSSGDSAANRGVIHLNGASTAIFSLYTGGTRRGYLYTQGTDIIASAEGGAFGIQTTTSQPITFSTNSTERARITSGGQALFGSTSENLSRWGRALFNYPCGTSNSVIGVQNNTARAANNLYGIVFADNTDESNAAVYVRQTGANNAADLLFGTNAGTGGAGLGAVTERARITSDGDFNVGNTGQAFSTKGASLAANGTIYVTRDAGIPMWVNRLTDDGTLVEFAQATTVEGSISVSGNTVSYNAFAGSHWSQLQDGSKPDILRGTVMESINELCVWPGENNERLPKAKISDTAGSKKVYGVFMAWDNDWTETNDMYVTAVGAFICRVNGSVTVQEGDLLESNGDGTARVQADDIIRSSTIGKVTSTVKTHQYDDGSYCVPTVLYCG